MDRYEQILLDAAKDTVNVLKEEGYTNKEIGMYLDGMLDGLGERSVEFTKEVEALKEERPILDDLIKNATDKAKDQPSVESPTKDLER